jgi:O-antigen/teichoic acid export membrane protein
VSVHAGFARRAGLVALGQSAVKATQLVLAISLVRLLNPSEWNETAYLLSIYLAATAVGTLNIQHGILFFFPRVAAERRRALVVQNLGVLLVIGTVIGLGLTLAAPALSGGRLGDASRLPLLGLAIALELPVVCTEMTMIAARRFTWSAIWDIAGSALVIAATVVPVALGAGVAGIVHGLLIAAGVRLVGSLVVINRLVDGPLFGLGGRFLARQIAYAVPLGATLGVSILNRAIDKWFIAAFRPGDFGVYAVAAQEIPLLSVLPYAGGAVLVAALVDAFHDGDVHLARTHWIHLTMTMSTFVVPMSMALVLIAPEALTGVFTAEFAAGVLPFQLFTLVTMHRVAEYGMLLRAAGRNRALLQVALFTLLANAAFAGAGAYVGGMTGASLGTLLASVCGWALALRQIADVLEVPVRMAFAWRAWISCVAIATGSACLAWLVLQSVSAPAGLALGARIAIKLLVFAAAYVGGVWAWRRSPRSSPPETIVLPICLRSPAQTPVEVPIPALAPVFSDGVLEPVGA